jgi:hypothetical protein
MLLEPILKAQRDKGVRMRVGSHLHAKELLFMPDIFAFVGDNVGSHQCACCKTGKTFKPCRCCDADRHDIHFPDKKYERRDADYIYRLQRAGYNAFSKRIFKEVLTASDKLALKLCKLESVQPMPAYLLGIPKPFPDHNAFFRFPPDLLHTVAAGLLKCWVFWTMVIIVKISETDVLYKDSVNDLDNLLKGFPNQQSASGNYKIILLLQNLTVFHTHRKKCKICEWSIGLR